MAESRPAPAPGTSSTGDSHGHTKMAAPVKKDEPESCQSVQLYLSSDDDDSSLDFNDDSQTRTLLEMITVYPEDFNSQSQSQCQTPPEDEQLPHPSCQRNQKKRPRFGPFSSDPVMESPAKKSRILLPEKKQSFIVKGKEMRAFFALLDDPVIGAFLSRDSCKRVSDKYLLAMTFTYFKRAAFSLKEYNRINFFLALYLANDLEEDEEDGKYEIFPWALGDNWPLTYPAFIHKRDRLWKRMGYRAVVSRKCCEEVMAIEPESPFWRRERPEHHAGAVPDHLKPADDDGYPRGPDGSPRECPLCDLLQYDSASPGSPSWYVTMTSSSDSSPDDYTKLWMRRRGRFDMDGLKDTLEDEFSIWAHGSEE